MSIARGDPCVTGNALSAALYIYKHRVCPVMPALDRTTVRISKVLADRAERYRIQDGSFQSNAELVSHLLRNFLEERERRPMK